MRERERFPCLFWIIVPAGEGGLGHWCEPAEERDGSLAIHFHAHDCPSFFLVCHLGLIGLRLGSQRLVFGPK